MIKDWHSLRNFLKNKKKIGSFFCILLLLLIPLELFIYSSKSTEEDELYWKTFLAHNKISSIPIPTNLQFAGEKVPVNDFLVIESMERELLVNTYFHSQTLLLHKRANRWLPFISDILKKNNVPDDFKYIALVESNLSNVVSPRGAAGFWQLMKGTANEVGLEITDEVDERYHIEKATEAACKYILKAHKELGTWTLAAASYNIGVEGLKKQLDKQNSTSYYDLSLNDETARYVFRILAIKDVITNPKHYGFALRKKDLYPFIPTQKIAIDSSITDFGLFAQQYGISYKVLKHFNPWLKLPFLTNKTNKEYMISIPKPGYNEFYASFVSGADSIPNTKTDFAPLLPDSVKGQ